MNFRVILLLMCFLPRLSNAIMINDLDPNNYTEKAQIILLDKLSEKSNKPILKKNEIFKYKALEITLESCWLHKNEAASLIMIEEIIKSKKLDLHEDDQRKVIFHGWIWNNNFGVSHMEHQLYQVHLLKCVK